MIYNPVAGHRDVEAEVVKAHRYLQSLGWEVKLCHTQAAGHATELANEAREAGVDLVVAMGGDGTIGQVADGLANGDTRMGVIPVGTGNVWAHMLGIPVWSPTHRNGIMEAARVLAEGETRHIDVGWADGRHFLLWAGIGFDAQVAHGIEPHREVRRSLGNWAYLITALAQGLVLRGVRATVIIDGRAYRQRLLMLVVSNVQLYGPYWDLAPQAQLDDGWLDVHLFKGTSMFDLARHVFPLVAGRRSVGPQVESYRARRVSVLADRPLPVHLDGDPQGETPVNIEVVPRALQVVVPRWSPNELFEEGGFEVRQEGTLGDRINARLQELLARWQTERHKLLAQIAPESEARERDTDTTDEDHRD